MLAVTSLGLKLVHALSGQIGGSFKIEGRDGTRCVIEFPIDGNSSD